MPQCPACKRRPVARRNLCADCFDAQESLDTFFASGSGFHGGQGRTPKDVADTGWATAMLGLLGILAGAAVLLWIVSASCCDAIRSHL